MHVCIIQLLTFDEINKGFTTLETIFTEAVGQGECRVLQVYKSLY